MQARMWTGIACALSVNVLAVAQMNEDWLARVEGGLSTSGSKIVVDGADNVIVAGNKDSNYQVIKYSPDGTELWRSSYSAGPFEDVNDLAVDGAGNIYVTGESDGGSTWYDFATVKYNADGVEQWVARYDGTSDLDRAYAIAVDADGSAYVTGSARLGSYFSKAVTIKYDADGNELWVAVFDEGDSGKDIAVDAAGNVYVAGVRSDYGTSSDYLLIKYDTEGNELWDQRYNGSGNLQDLVTKIAVDVDGNAIITGRSLRTQSAVNYDMTTVKYAPDGTELWVSRINGSADAADAGNDLAVDAAGNVHVVGYLTTGTQYDLTTVKLDADGNELWRDLYDGPVSSFDTGKAIALDYAGNVYVTASSYGPGTDADWVALKYDAAGVRQWEMRYDGPSSLFDVPADIAVDSFGDVVLSGTSQSSEFGYALVALKYAGIPGDCNCDGNVDFDDINPFVMALGGRSVYLDDMANCNWYNADLNGDGDVTFDDIDLFVAELGGGL